MKAVLVICLLQLWQLEQVLSSDKCDSECINHYYNCVKKPVDDNPKADEVIDCSDSYYQLRCSRMCDVCTGCTYVTTSEFEDAVEELEEDNEELKENIQEKIQQLEEEVDSIDC